MRHITSGEIRARVGDLEQSRVGQLAPGSPGRSLVVRTVIEPAVAIASQLLTTRLTTTLFELGAVGEGDHQPSRAQGRIDQGQ